PHKKRLSLKRSSASSSNKTNVPSVRGGDRDTFSLNGRRRSEAKQPSSHSNEASHDKRSENAASAASLRDQCATANLNSNPQDWKSVRSVRISGRGPCHQ